jgi:type IV pilus assembly protein PilE
MMKTGTRHSRGFTLTELMIVLVVIAILAALAYPTYQDQMRKTRRAEAKTALTTLSARMEGYYADQGTYVGATPAALLGSAQSENGHYTLTINPLTANAYTLNAAPTAGGAQVGDPCGTLTLTSLGVKGKTGAATGCW